MANGLMHVELEQIDGGWIIKWSATGKEACRVMSKSLVDLMDMVNRLEATERMKELKQLGY
jgi:hypothetical protein